jgi:hypothetical protein
VLDNRTFREIEKKQEKTCRTFLDILNYIEPLKKFSFSDSASKALQGGVG